MELRLNILFSLILHAMIIIAVFAVSVSVGDTTERLRTDYLTVSLFKETTGTTSMLSQKTKKDEDKISSVIIKREATKQSPSPLPPPRGGRVRVGVFTEETASPELVLSNKTRFFANVQNDKDEEARNDNPIYHSLLNTTSEISKDTTTSSGQYSGKSEETTLSRNTGFSMIKSSHHGNTNNPYALIRSAIEKARTYPFLARKNRIEGTVITGFTINSKGYPQDIKIEKSSGSEILDSAAIKIVMKAAPFPAVDGEIAVPISFKLTGYTSSYISSR